METEAQAVLIREVGDPIYRGKTWLKILGILTIVYGAILVFTIVGILIAWLPIWMGVLLIQSASSIEAVRASGAKEDLVRSLGKLRLYFTIAGILAVILLAAALLGFALGFLGFLGAMMAGMQGA
jgi:hypothetical protein